jgi:hypothetical protein
MCISHPSSECDETSVKSSPIVSFFLASGLALGGADALVFTVGDLKLP